MKIEDVISMARSRLVYLASMRETAVRLGDLAQIEQIDAEVADTKSTLVTLEGVAR